MDQSGQSDLHFGSNPQTIIENNQEFRSDIDVETPEQRVAANVSQQLISNALESQTQIKQDKHLDQFELGLQTSRQSVPMDVFDQQFNQNIGEATEQNLSSGQQPQQLQQPFDAYQYEEEYEEEEEEEEEDSLEGEPNKYESRATVNEANIESDLLFTASPQSNEPLIQTESKGNEQILYQLPEDSDALRAQDYGIASDLKIDSQIESRGNEELLYQFSEDSDALRAQNYGIESDLRIGSQTDNRGNEEVLYQLSEDSDVLRAQDYGIASDLRIDSQIESRGNEEVFCELPRNSNALGAQNYGVESDLRIDSQTDQSLENISDYGLSSSDPFRTPEKKVVQSKVNEDFSGYTPSEMVSTDFGVSSSEEKSNLLDLDISSPELLPNMTDISHSVEVIDAKRDRNHSQTSSESDGPLDKREDSYVVTSSADVSTLPTHTFAETVSLNDSIANSTDSTTTNHNETDFTSTEPPNLETLSTTTNISPTSISSQQPFQFVEGSELSKTTTQLEQTHSKESPETSFVPIIAKTMAKQQSQATSTTSGECATCPFGPSAWFNPKQLNPTVAELVYWRDPKKSGIVFGSGLAILLSLTFFSIISVVAYASLASLSVTLSFRIYKNILQAVQKTNEGHPFKEYLELEITPSNERIHQIVDSLLTHVNCTINKLRSVFLVEDIVDSLKFVVLFWCLTYIGSWFNGLTLVILAYLATFSLPKVYEMNKTQIDQYLNLACTQINEITSKVRAKIPFPAKKDKEN